jgi:glycosyltransferase involved in cell wall biosynthesis
MRNANYALRLLLHRWLHNLMYVCSVPVVILVQLLSRQEKRLLLWGPIPIINNKYWSAAMGRAGWASKTLMVSHYSSINRAEDFDLYFDDLVRWLRPKALRTALAPLVAHLYVTRHARAIHIPFSGGPLASTPLWRLEAHLYRLSGVRTVVVPYGADIFRYSQIPDPAVRQALMLSYPDAGREETSVANRVHYWVRHADAIVVGFTLEGIGRWDVPAGNMVCIDLDAWKPKGSYSAADGRSEPVKVLHAPNHRGAKGTEFLVAAVEELKREGLAVDLVLVERVQNEEVRRLMQDVDILADQFVLPGYGLGSIEGMATGLPVMANLALESYTRIFRRYSYLNECPILSTTPETLKEDLSVLIRNPALRRALGAAGREYVEKYHSDTAAQYLFGSIYRKLFDDEGVDLMNLFHPLKSSYNCAKPRVAHPLVENRLPPDYPLQC